MGLSILIARVLSVIYLSAGLGALISADHFRRLPDDLFRNAGVTFVTGFITVILGLLIVHYHQATKGWPVLITLVGWLALLKGIAIIVAPQWVHDLSVTMISGWGMKAFPYVAIGLGLLFGYFGFGTKVPTQELSRGSE